MVAACCVRQGTGTQNLLSPRAAVLTARQTVAYAWTPVRERHASRYVSCGPLDISRRLLRQAPEVADQAQPVEYCLVLVSRVRPPVAIKPIRVPRKAELHDIEDWNGHSWLASSEPSRNVLFRPEEIHRCSREDDVVPPLARRDQAVEQQACVIRSPVLHFNRHSLTAVRARCFQLSISVQGAEDAERVPCAIGVPPPTIGVYSIGTRDGREWIQHSGLGRRLVQHQTMSVVQPPPSGADVIDTRPDFARNLDCGRRSPERSQLAIGHIPEVDVSLVHQL